MMQSQALLQDLQGYRETLRLPGGRSLVLRFVEAADVAALLAYLHALSDRSRYNRFLGARRHLTETEIERMLQPGEANGFAVIGTLVVAGFENIVCEVRYAFDSAREACEFGLSVADAWQRQGIGAALLSNLECRASAFGATRLFGDTLRSNEPMHALARKLGFAPTRSPEGWKFVRLEKTVDRAVQQIPCVQWRTVAASITHVS